MRLGLSLGLNKTVVDYNGGDGFPSTLLLHMNGADGSTSFPDASYNNVVTSNGDAQIDTAQSKFGGASGLFDGLGDFLSMPDNDNFDFGAGDFTMDMWIRPANVSSFHYIVGRYNNSDNGCGIITTNTEIRFFYSTTGSDFLFIDTVGANLTVNTWTHVACVRNGADYVTYIDGVIKGTLDLGTTSFNESSMQLAIGSQQLVSPKTYFAGHMDELRVLKGTAAWTGAFTPPNSAYIS